MRVVGIAGQAQHGKSTAAAEIVRHCNLVGKKSVVVSLADPLRAFVAAQNPVVSAAFRYNEVVEMLGYEEAKRVYPEVRRLLQVTGTEAARDIFGEEVWIDACERSMMQASIENVDVFIVPDVRFENEVDFIGDCGGLLVHVTRCDERGNVFDNGIAKDHPSEAYANEAAKRSTYGVYAPDLKTLEVAIAEFVEGWLL